MRWELDKKRKIVDFYVEDESGREYHAGMSLDHVVEMLLDILGEIEDGEERASGDNVSKSCVRKNP